MSALSRDFPWTIFLSTCLFLDSSFCLIFFVHLSLSLDISFPSLTFLFPLDISFSLLASLFPSWHLFFPLDISFSLLTSLFPSWHLRLLTYLSVLISFSWHFFSEGPSLDFYFSWHSFLFKFLFSRHLFPCHYFLLTFTSLCLHHFSLKSLSLYVSFSWHCFALTPLTSQWHAKNHLDTEIGTQQFEPPQLYLGAKHKKYNSEVRLKKNCMQACKIWEKRRQTNILTQQVDCAEQPLDCETQKQQRTDTLPWRSKISMPGQLLDCKPQWHHAHSNYWIVFHFILPCSPLLCSALFYSTLFFSILFHSVLFCSILCYSILFCSILLCSSLVYSSLLSTLFYSILLSSALLCSFALLYSLLSTLCSLLSTLHSLLSTLYFLLYSAPLYSSLLSRHALFFATW